MDSEFTDLLQKMVDESLEETLIRTEEIVLQIMLWGYSPEAMVHIYDKAYKRGKASQT